MPNWLGYVFILSSSMFMLALTALIFVVIIKLFKENEDDCADTGHAKEESE